MRKISRSRFNFASLLLFLFLGTAANGQTPAAIEQELLGYLKTMAETGSYSGEYDEEKLTPASAALKEKLKLYATREDVLKYSFPKLKEEMFIATSADGNLRVYSWDLQTGGTMHDYDVLFQYRGASGKIRFVTTSEEDFDGGGAFYTDVFQLDSKGGRIYMLVSTSRASSSLNAQALRTMRINGDELERDVNLIRTPQGLTNEVGFAYDFFSVVDRPERPIRLFTFNTARREFRFPIVIEDREFPQGRVTNRYITYRFNGTHFVKVR